MSGIEVAGVALGIFPIIVEAAKAYKGTYETIQTIRQTKEQFRILEAEFRRCKTNFLIECQLLLELAFPNQQWPREVMRCPDEPNGQDGNAISLTLENLLKENYGACKGMIRDTEAMLRDFQSRLARCQLQIASQKSFYQVRFILAKSRFDRDIASLRTHTADINMLRTQLTAFKSIPKRTEQPIYTSVILLERLEMTRKASDRLYETLSEAWSCADKSHSLHLAKLCLDAEVKPDIKCVNLDMAITHQKQLGLSTECVREPLIWLYVRSSSLESANGDRESLVNELTKALELQRMHKTTFASPKGKSSSAIGSSCYEKHSMTNLPRSSITQLVPDNLTRCRPPSSSGLDMNPQRDTLTQQQRGKNPATTTTSKDDYDLCKINNICLYFKEQLRTSDCHLQGHCLGYLQCQNQFKYHFYPPRVLQPVTNNPATAATSEITSIQTLIQTSNGPPLQTLHQYQIALKIAKAVLQFHSTPWLEAKWRLQDVSIFGSQLSDRALRTLHLNAEFREQAPVISQNFDGQQQSRQTFSSGENALENTGPPANHPVVYNEDLFSLGVALLEIAHWRPLQSMIHDEPDEVNKAHRLARRDAPLGSIYRKIAERCIRCDFGVSSDLKNEDLQEAVWSRVVLPLEEIIRGFS